MFNEMKYVYEVYKQGSFTQAAAKLFISQPSLSIMIKKAENRLGTPIFDRSTSPIGLTAAGRGYIEAARQIMEIENQFTETISNLENCLTGNLSIGGTTLFTSYVLPALLNTFSAEYPGIDIEIHESTSTQLMKEVLNGDLDIVLDNSNIPANDFDTFLYRKEEIILAVPRTYKINQALSDSLLLAEDFISGNYRNQKKVSLSAFINEPFLLLKLNNDTRMKANEMFRETDCHPKIKLELDQQLTAYNLAAYGLGVAFISDTLIKNTIPDSRLYFYRLNTPLAEREIHFYCKKNRRLPKAVQCFIQKFSL